MPVIHRGYFILILLLTAAYLLFMFYKSSYLTFNDGNFLSLISTIISIFALGLVNAKNPQFKGSIKAKMRINALNEQNPIGDNSPLKTGTYHRVDFEINNYKKVPLTDSIKVRFKFPKDRICFAEKDIVNGKFKHHKQTTNFLYKGFDLIGTGRADSKEEISLFFNLIEWAKRNVYVTISADNISPTTFILGHKQIEGFQENRMIKLKKSK